MTKTDCFAYAVTAGGIKTCIALTGIVCASHEKCAFYKTRQQYNKDKVAPYVSITAYREQQEK